MPQPPNLAAVAHVLGRCEALHGPEAATQLGEWLTEDWRYARERAGDPAGQLVWAAAQQLVRAARHRAAGHASIANMIDHLAEAAALGWVDELAVGAQEVPEHP